MPTLVVKNLPINILRRLREEARKAHRSLTHEAIFLLEAELSRNARPVPAFPAPYKGKKPLTVKLIQRWKRAGMA